MEEGKLLREIVEVLSKDGILVKENQKFADYLGIPDHKVVPLIRQFDHGNCTPYALIRGILSQWISKQGDKATLAELMRILLQMNCKAPADKLKDLAKKHPGPIQPPNQQGNSGERDSGTFGMPDAQGALCSRNPPQEETKPIMYGVKDVVLNFIGREEELKKLNEHFHSGERFVVISGLGGVGKTELTKKFVLTATLHGTAKSIAKSWLSGESPQSLLNSTAEFCIHLNLTVNDSDGKPLVIEKMLHNIINKLKSSAGFSRWLVVIDNVDETHEEFQVAVKILHDFRPNVFLLVTSRRRDIYAGESEHLELTTLKQEDSIEFVKQSLKITDNSADEAIKSLCNQLDNFSLALSQAVAYIKQQQILTLTGRAYGVQNYLDELSKTETLGLDKDFQLAEYPKATLKVWHITLDKIKECHGADGAMALDLLNVMAFINPDEIHLQFLCKLFKLFYAIEEIDMNQIDSCLTILLHFSLISSYNSVMNIHRLVQLAVRTRMATTDQKNHRRKDIQFLETFWTSFKSRRFYSDEMTNILKIWNHSSKHPELDVIRASRVKDVFDKLDNLGIMDELLEVASEGCALILKLYGAESKEYFQMVLRLEIALNYKREYKASLEKLTFVYDKLKELCGEEDEDTLEAGRWIVIVLRRLRKYEESLEWGQKILQSKIRIYGKNHKSTIETKRDLATTLGSLERKEEEMEMHNEILESEEVRFGKDDLLTTGTRHRIALCLYDVEKYPEAPKVFQKVISVQEEHFGVDHPGTLDTEKRLAKTLEKMGKIEEALKIYEGLLIVQEKVNKPFGLYYFDELSERERVRHLKMLVKIKNDDHSITDSY